MYFPVFICATSEASALISFYCHQKKNRHPCTSASKTLQPNQPVFTVFHRSHFDLKIVQVVSIRAVPPQRSEQETTPSPNGAVLLHSDCGLSWNKWAVCHTLRCIFKGMTSERFFCIKVKLFILKTSKEWHQFYIHKVSNVSMRSSAMCRCQRHLPTLLW